MSGMRLFTELTVTCRHPQHHAIDVLAFAFFLAAWVGYAAFATRYGARVPSLQTSMDGYRRYGTPPLYDPDEMDGAHDRARQPHGGRQHHAQSHAQLAVLRFHHDADTGRADCIDGLRAAGLSCQQLDPVVSGLPFTVKGTVRATELKILLLVVIFVYAFFKFSWGIRNAVCRSAQLFFGSRRRGTQAAAGRCRAACRIHRPHRAHCVVSQHQFQQRIARLLFRAGGARVVPASVAHDRRNGVGGLRALPARIPIEDLAGARGGRYFPDNGHLSLS